MEKGDFTAKLEVKVEVTKISLKWHMASLNLGPEHFCGCQSV